MPDQPGPAAPSAFLSFAIDAVREAGVLQMEAFGGQFEVTKKGIIDLVTEVDVRVERAFRERVARAFPDHDVLGEEMGGAPTGDRHGSHCWIFDPIDGTTNFAHGVPIFCAALALEIHGRVEVAAVYDPTRDELFSAERGHGAWLNGRPMRVSTTDRLLDALLVTGFPYSVHSEPGEMLGLFEAFIRRSRAVRRLGSAAIDVCYVAAGRMDGFWEQGLSAWDIAAAALLVEEAGGRLSDLDGGPFEPRRGRLVASNGLLHDEMLATIRSFYERWRA